MRTLNVWEVIQEYRTIKHIDLSITGRYCGSLEDKLTQNFVAYLSSKIKRPHKTPAHIDVGVLFGGSTISLAITLNRNSLTKYKVIAIDPFEGYYGQKVDPKTKHKVTKATFLENIKKFNLEGRQFKIINKFSQQVHLRSVKKYCITSILIDGDHSYRGIKADWEKYSKLVIKNGYVIIDDYEDPSWPDVKKFIDNMLKRKSQNWRIIIKLDTTLVLQKKK